MEALLTNPSYIQYLSEFQSKFKTFSCDISTEIGDVVYIDSIETNTIVVNTDNRNYFPSVGVVVKKLTNTSAKVQIFGECALPFTNLQKSKNVFLGIDGKPTNIIPDNGFIQKIGFCLEDSKFFISVDYWRVKRTPF